MDTLGAKSGLVKSLPVTGAIFGIAIEIKGCITREFVQAICVPAIDIITIDIITIGVITLLVKAIDIKSVEVAATIGGEAIRIKCSSCPLMNTFWTKSCLVKSLPESGAIFSIAVEIKRRISRKFVQAICAPAIDIITIDIITIGVISLLVIACRIKACSVESLDVETGSVESLGVESLPIETLGVKSKSIKSILAEGIWIFKNNARL